MFLAPEQIELFHRRGYIVIPGFFAADTVEAVSDWMDKLSKKDPASDEEAKYYERSPLTGESVLVRAEHIFGDFNVELAEKLMTPKAMGCLEELLGEPAVLFKEKVNYKAPGCRPDKLHQDQAAGWNAFCGFFVTMAMAVDENRKDNAALTFMSSGNYEKQLMTEEWKPITTDDPPYQPVDEYSLLEANPGDVIFFDSYVPHGSPANSSDRLRRNLFLTFNRVSHGDMRRRYYEEKWKSYPPNRIDDDRDSSSYRV